MEKILILIFHQVSDERINFIIKIISCFKPAVTIIAPIDRHLVTRMASNEGIKEEILKERLINEAYMDLYHLEDTFTKEGIEVNIATTEMSSPEELIQDIRKINPKMLLIVGKIEPSIIESLFSVLSIPILIMPVEE